ncbi:unnamed protein product, partial [Heterosigma akashiwo]
MGWIHLLVPGIVFLAVMNDTSSLLTTPRVFIKNVDDTMAKIRRFIEDGADNLQLISDFDYTLTKFNVNGRKGASCHGILE